MFRRQWTAFTAVFASLVAALLQGIFVYAADEAFINEFHYDNEGTDTGEFVEVAYTDGLDISGYTLVLYNGNGGSSYNTVNVPTGTLVSSGNNNNVRLSVMDISGIQNGAPDGMALVSGSNQVIEFLSYEGTFTATNGPANGMTSTDIGASESGTTPVGDSLQRSGTGCSASDFPWDSAPQPETKGSLNAGQTFDCSGSSTNGGSGGFSDTVSSSQSGSWTGTVSVTSGSTTVVGDLPTGHRDVYLELDCSSFDGDLELFLGDTKLVGSSGTVLSGTSWKSNVWNSLRLEYSGTEGELHSGTFGQEYLFLSGTLSSTLQVRVFGASGGGTCDFMVNWGYYNQAYDATDSDLKSTLHQIIDDHTELSYTPGVWDALKRVDQDKNNSDNVIGIYTRRSIPKADQDDGSGDPDAWNREHVWPKSQGDFGTSAGAGTDIHSLRAADRSVNTARSNQDFANGGDPVEDCSGCKETADTFEPPDEVKGAVARMIFYMATRYNGDVGSNGVELIVGPGYYESTSTTVGELGDLDTLKSWNVEFPPSDEEYNRNNLIFQIQGNRNPYIDHPEWVDTIWSSGNLGGSGSNTSNGFAGARGSSHISALLAVGVMLLSSFVLWL